MSSLIAFRYRARDAAGTEHTGAVEAADVRAAVAQLRGRSLVPVSVEPEQTSVWRREISLPSLSRGVDLSAVAAFARQFATMIDSGLTLLRALAVLAEETDDATLAAIIRDVRGEVETGRALSAALADHAEFPQVVVAMIRAGEAAGALDEVLLQVADMLEHEVDLRSRVKSAMSYPAVVLVAAAVLTSVMLLFIVPTFVAMFDQLGGELPLPTAVLLALSTAARRVWWLGLLLGVGGWQLWRHVRTRPGVRERVDAALLRVPILGPLAHKMALTRFARTLGVLLQSGVPILTAVDITADTIGNAAIANDVDEARRAIEQGDPIAAPLRRSTWFPSMTVQMIAVGEETGAIDTMLLRVATYLDREVQAAAASLSSSLQPILVGVVGTIIGAMVLAMYLPMFRIFDLIQ